MGAQVTAALTKNLERIQSEEQRRSVEKLLADLKRRQTVPSQDELRELRAIEVLEVIGTPSAQAVLESLVRGAPEARLTDEAASAVKRLDLPIKK